MLKDEELYSGTSYNFLGSEPIISRHSHQSPLRTEYAIPWLNGKWARELAQPDCFSFFSVTLTDKEFKCLTWGKGQLSNMS